jgi:hypothetical protein
LRCSISMLIPITVASLMFMPLSRANSLRSFSIVTVVLDLPMLTAFIYAVRFYISFVYYLINQNTRSVCWWCVLWCVCVCEV